MPPTPGRFCRPSPPRDRTGRHRRDAASAERRGMCRSPPRSRRAAPSRSHRLVVRPARAKARARPRRPLLRRRERRDVGCAPMQLDVGLAAHDAGRRARRVEQDAIERTAIPPGFGLRRHRRSPRSAASPRRFEVLANARQARGVAEIERDQIELGALEHVRSLAAGRGAGVEHALSIGKIEQVGDALRGAVLHREEAVRITGQDASRRCCGPARSHRQASACAAAAMPSASGRRSTAARSRSPRRRLTRSVSGASRVVRGDDRVGIVRPVAAQRVDQPARMRRARDFVGVELARRAPRARARSGAAPH